jgi:hypothetical protein
MPINAIPIGALSKASEKRSLASARTASPVLRSLMSRVLPWISSISPLTGFEIRAMVVSTQR